jgi:amino-acid N-acetyltransferase
MIRKATLDDIPAIINLVRHFPDTVLERTTEEYGELLETTWVADESGRVVGSVVLEVYSPKICEVRSVVVHPEFHGSGLGKQLINVAVEEGIRRNIRQIIVVTSAPDYFRKLGFGECLHEKFAMFWAGRDGSTGRKE